MWMTFLSLTFAAFPDVPANVTQLVIVRAAPGAVFKSTLQRYQRMEGEWQTIGPAIDAVLGKKGIAPAGDKKEGDSRTPAGLYPLESAFGYAASADTRLDYRQSTDEDVWIDDVASPDYNRWVRGATKAKSFERMKRKDDLYALGVVVGYNTQPVVPGKGSAIFLHVWRSAASGTAGCVAMKKEDMASLLAWLDAAKHPMVSIER